MYAKNNIYVMSHYIDPQANINTIIFCYTRKKALGLDWASTYILY